MADKKRLKQRRVEEEKPSKEEYAVAKFLRFNLPPREGKLHGMEVQCFIGSAAVDKLLESKWSAAKNAKEPLFTNRLSCVFYMLRLLEKGLFHRAERDKKKKDKDDKERTKKKKKDKEEKEENTAAEEEVRERKGKKNKKGKKEGEVAEEETEKKAEAEKKGETEKKDEKKKKEKRLKLVMPDQQFFEDGDEVYVWIYDPIKPKNFIIGLLMVLGAIALCMFPLWPAEVRLGVYYLSLSSAGFVGFILSLVVVRLVLFCFVWVLTIGRHHFWFLPNLTEDVGFFDSFKPLYKHDYMPNAASSSSSNSGSGKSKEEKKKQKGPKAVEDSTDKKEKSSDKDDSDEFEVIKKEDLVDNGGDEDKDLDEGEEEEEGEDNAAEEETDQNEEEDYEDDNDEEEEENFEEEEEESEEGEMDPREKKKKN